MPTPRQLAQRAILRRKGLKPGHYRGLKVTELSSDSTKTLAMRLLEREFETQIEDLLTKHEGLAATARYLGIDPSTVSKWRLKLGLREPRAGVLDVS